MKEKNLMWIVIVITALGLAVKIIFDNYKQAHKSADVCYIDAPQIIDKLAVIYSLDVNKSLENADNTTKEKAEMLMNRLRLVLQNPEKFGCKTIFMKGAILSGGKDITGEVLKDVSGGQTQ